MVTPPAAVIHRGASDSDPSVVMTIEPGVASISLPQGIPVSGAHVTRVGDDLVIAATDGQHAVVRDYFAGHTTPDVVGADGSILTGDLAVRLAPLAPGQFAQATPSVSEAIGEVDNVAGTAIATRADGTRVVLQAGDPVYQGDVLETGPDGAIGIVFADETAFAMAANGRMVLDEMIYDPANPDGGLFSMSIVQGVFSFVSGEVAKANPDAMTVHTPVATIGIRGTQVGVDFKDGHTLSVVDMEELGGFVGEIVVTNDGGVMILNRAGAFTVVNGVNVAPSEIAFLTDAEIVRFFASALSHLPLPNGNENNYGVANEGDLSFLEDFTTAAGGEESVIGGTDDFIPVTNGSPPFTPVPTFDGGGSPFGGGGGGPGGPGGGPGGPGTTTEFTPGIGEPGLGGPTDPFGGFDSVFLGGDGNDTIPGGEQDNAGRDFIYGGGGNDTLTGGDSDDVVYGGDGDDVIIGGTGNGDDQYFGGNPPANFGLGTNGEDNDIFGDTVIYPSTSEGVIVNLNNANEVVIRSDGSLLVALGSTATDLLPVSDQDPAANHIDVDFLSQIEHVAGGSGGDVLIGDEGDNQLWGEWTTATVFGDDTLFAGSGNDVVIGSGGDDFVLAGASVDAPGSDGDDQYFGGFVTTGFGEGGEPVFASAGDAPGAVNTISYQLTVNGVDVDLDAGTAQRAAGVPVDDDEIGVDTLNDFSNVIGGDGDDTLRGDGGANQLLGGAGDDTIDGRAGADTLSGGDGDDVLLGGAGDDILDGGDGIDTASYADQSAAVTVNLSTGEASGDGIGDDTLSNIEMVIGGSGDDTLTGGSGDDTLDGGEGSDTIDAGGEGVDTLLGGDGDDTIRVYGGSTVDGGEGIDTVTFGDDGAQQYKDVVIATVDGTTTVTHATGVVDTLMGVEFLAFDDGGIFEIATGILRGTDAGDGLDGGDGDDAIEGVGGDDEISGGGGDDDIQGDDGDDIIDGGQGSDSITGGAGNDHLIGGDGDDTLEGLEGDDTLEGSAGSDELLGGAGDDDLSGDDGDDTLEGGEGDDTFQAGSDGGDDTIDGGEGSDTLDYGSAAGAVAVNLGGSEREIALADGSAILLAGATAVDVSVPESGGIGQDTLAGVEHVRGSAFADIIVGDSAANHLFGGGGDDVIAGGGGGDVIAGEGGNNTVIVDLSVSADMFFGGFVTQVGDTFVANGTDGPNAKNVIDFHLAMQSVTVTLKNPDLAGTATGDEIGTDQIFNFSDVIGGAGNDTLTGNSGANRLVGGAGDDVLNGGPGFGKDELDGGDGNDKLSGGSGNDILYGSRGTDILDGGANESGDTVDYSHFDTEVVINLSGSKQESVDAGTALAEGFISTLIGIENATGGAGNDHIFGGDGGSFLVGGAGNDVISGGTNTDTLSGGAGDDTLNGNNGNDTLEGGAGNDKLTGGEGSDTATYVTAGSGVTVDLAKGTARGEDTGDDTLVSIENLFGSHFDDLLTGDDKANKLEGSLGVDVLIGGGGNDTLNGGDGDDVMTGGSGADRFIFDINDATDSILDFGINGDAGDKGDKIFLNGANVGEFTIEMVDADSGLSRLVWSDGDDTLTIDIHGSTLNGYDSVPVDGGIEIFAQPS